MLRIDEIIVEAPDLTIEKVAQILKESMINAGQRYLKEMPVQVDVSVANNWFEK